MSQIDDRYLSDMLKQLLETPSPTGYTDEITRLCCRELERLNIGYEITRRGAIRALIRGGERQPGRAIIGHIDTLGAQVKGLKSNGRLEVRMIGH